MPEEKTIGKTVNEVLSGVIKNTITNIAVKEQAKELAYDNLDFTNLYSEEDVLDAMRKNLSGYYLNEVQYIVDGAKIRCTNMKDQGEDTTIFVPEEFKDSDFELAQKPNLPVPEEEGDEGMVRVFSPKLSDKMTGGDKMFGTVDDTVSKYAIKIGAETHSSWVNFYSLGHCKHAEKKLTSKQFLLLEKEKKDVKKYGHVTV